MKFYRITVLLLLAIALFVFRVSTGIAAQETDVPRAVVTAKPQEHTKGRLQGPADETRTVGERLKELQGELDRLSADLAKAGDAEKSIIQAQRRRTHAELRDQLKSFTKAYGALEAAGGDASEYKDRAVVVTKEVSRYLMADIDATTTLLANLDEQLRTAPGEQAADLKRQVSEERAAVDDMLRALLENTQRMEALGIDNALGLEYLNGVLKSRASRLAGEIRLLVEQRKSIRQQLGSASEDDKKVLSAKITALDERIKLSAVNLRATVNIMQKRSMETGEYKQLLITSTGEISEDIFETQVAMGLLQQSLDTGKEWIIADGPRWVFKLVVFVLILFAFKLLANIARRIVRQSVSSSRLEFSQLLRDFFVSFTGRVVFFIGILIALSQLGIKLGPVLAGLGIAGFIAGFALQDTLSNFAAGLMILIYRPYDVGDAVEAGGVTGTVKQMNLVSTTIATWDNQRVVVPNKKIWGDVIRNINAEGIRRIDMTFNISYEDDIGHAERVLREIVNSHELVLEEPAPNIRLHTLGESSVDFIVRPWVQATDYWTAYWDITRAVKARFDTEGISIPFPQQDMHVYQHLPEPLAGDKGTA